MFEVNQFVAAKDTRLTACFFILRGLRCIFWQKSRGLRARTAVRSVDPLRAARYRKPQQQLGTDVPGGFTIENSAFWTVLRVQGKAGAQLDPKGHTMANTSSAQKAARQMIRRTEVNKARRTRVKSEVRAVEEAITSGDQAKALAALKSAQPILVRTAQKGMMHPKTASRKVSRLAARVKAMKV